MTPLLRAAAWILTATLSAAAGGGPANVLVVINRNSPISIRIGEYYARSRSIPSANLCRIASPTSETIARTIYDRDVAGAVARCLTMAKLREQILYIVTTQGVPLRIEGSTGVTGDYAGVDSELTLLYSDLAGKPHALPGGIPNPFFGQRSAEFRHSQHPMYLVTRLAGYDWNDVQGMMDRARTARNRGKVVLDAASTEERTGDDWLRTASLSVPADRVIFDESPRVLTGVQDVIAYAGWGSNDSHRGSRRTLGMHWLPGAIMTEYVSTNGRTFERPPNNWVLTDWQHPKDWFAGSPQSLVADYLHEGVTGAAGHVYEPYLQFTPRPNLLIPAYLSGRNLAESFWLSVPSLSWQNVVIGDPLCWLQPR